MAKRTFTRRQFLGTTAAAGAAAIGRFNIGRAHAETNGRVVILGFDGVEPSIVRGLIEHGSLPNLAKLQQQGTFAELGSTIPPQSPVAWTSFATCKNPGGHNIFDFIRRDPKGSGGPRPYVGTGNVEHVSFNPDGSVAAPPKAESYRKGLPFWKVADSQGARAKVLNVPFAYPADNLDNGVMLCGLGVPDLRGTTSTFISLSDTFSPQAAEERLSGGMRLKLSFDAKGTAQIDVPGPRDTREKFNAPGAFTLTPVRISVDRAGHVGKAMCDGKSVELKQGEWSEWLELPFKMSPSFTAHGIARFFPAQIGEQVHIYLSCMQFHPRHPYTAISEPDDYAAELADRFGLYKTIGWAYDTHAMRQDALSEEAFLADVDQTMAWREKLTLDEIDRGGFDLIVSAWTATDRVGHMFWRFRDEKHPLYDPSLAERYAKTLEQTYEKVDAIVGNVMAKLNDNDTLMILSDHGFESWRKGFNVNDWLRENGYLTVAQEPLAERGFLLGLDWAQTQAYAIGLSSMYLNLAGRETNGVVAQADADAKIAEIKDRLLAAKDPETGDKVFTNIYTRQDYKGEAMAQAPDISFGYARYYQSSKQAAKGGIAGTLFSPNDDKWSGEHAAADMAWIPGIFFCNRPIQKDAPNIRDLGATALALLKRDIPGDYEGDALL